MFIIEENGIANEAIYSSSVTGLSCLVRLQSCEKGWTGALLSVKWCCFVQTIAPAHRFFTTLKSHKAVQTCHWRTVGHENTWRWMVCCHKAL